MIFCSNYLPGYRLLSIICTTIKENNVLTSSSNFTASYQILP